ncbi:chitin synthase-domain-containing protein [Auriculariales sp. MPI-PUGE-AT-0066]|nr:chitin synthase-domain-containing protein [Auriculariales sp. MPI-PUGE-AT-0066]
MSYGHYHYPTTPTQGPGDEPEVERDLSYGTLDRAISAVAHPSHPVQYAQRYSPIPPRAAPLSPIRESGESAILRPGSSASGSGAGSSSGHSSYDTAVSARGLGLKLIDKRYKTIDEDGDDSNDEDDDDDDEEEDVTQTQQQQQQQQQQQYYNPATRYSANYGPPYHVQQWPSQHPAWRQSRPISYTVPSYQPPRSRSPTPDDYDIVEKHDVEAGQHKRTISDGSSGTLSVGDTPDPGNTQHYGPAPTGRMVRRLREKKRVKLHDGHLVVDLEIPSDLVLPYPAAGQEMKETRYTAVTCDPDVFVKKKFTLRQVAAGRSTELLVVITMYNEDEVLFTRTLYGVMKNISHLCQRKSSKVWGIDAWKKVVVCIVADGRKKVHPRILDCLTALGVYRADVMRNSVDELPVQGHMFEYTTSFGLDPNINFKYPDKGIMPTQILLLIKENNARKINSHRWCLNAFARVLQPNIVILLDVGTRPGHKSLYKLWKSFDMNSNVGGACGEIAVYKGPHWSGLINPLVAAQNFEYKMSNILDKPTEAMFGYINVLNDKHGNGPLATYFRGEFMHGRESNIFNSNMSRAGANWVLRYVPGAVAETDVPDNLPEFILQRRRWLNGSFFAALYSLWHVKLILTADHSIMRKVMLGIESFYNLINLVFAWFAIVLLTSGIEGLPNFEAIKYLNAVMQSLYAALIISSFIFSMGNKPSGSKLKYNLTVWLFAVLTVYMLVCAGLCVARVLTSKHEGAMYSQMMLSLLVTFGLYFLASLLAFDPWHLVTCFLQYLLLSPAYINVLNIYAFANIDDVSHFSGTKGEDKAPVQDLGGVVQDHQAIVEVEVIESGDVNAIYKETLQNLRERKPVPRKQQGNLDQAARDYYANVRTNVLLFWVLTNGFIVLSILGGGGAASTFTGDAAGAKQRAYMLFILSFVAITSIIRLVASTFYGLAIFFLG